MTASRPEGSGRESRDTAGGDRPAGRRLMKQRLMKQGWIGLGLWMLFGFLLESLMAYKIPSYLGDPQRRELMRLAHAHGTLLSLVLIAAAGFANPPRSARFALRAGSILLPIGFLLSGIWHPEGDPGMAIWLVPPGALLLIFGIFATTFAVDKE